MKTLANVQGLGEVVELSDDFYSELRQLKEAGAGLISPRDEAYTRLQTRGKENIGKDYGTRTSAGFEYVKDQLPIFRLNSRLLNPKLAKLAVEANRAGNYFYTGSIREYEESLKQAEKDSNKEPSKRNVVVLPSRDKFTLDNKQNYEILKAILKDQAEPYFELNGPIDVYPVDSSRVDAQDGTLITQLWFRNLVDRSSFNGDYRGLNLDAWARGVRKSAEGASQKIFESYTSKQISKALKKAKLSGIEEILFKELNR